MASPTGRESAETVAVCSAYDAYRCALIAASHETNIPSVFCVRRAHSGVAEWAESTSEDPKDGEEWGHSLHSAGVGPSTGGGEGCVVVCAERGGAGVGVSRAGSAHEGVDDVDERWV